ncbi:MULTISPECIES: MarR family transcriptional regulator [unclassified Rathayibacter]|uniref:MarR family transcriptional regulator n=1 Tax=unclassified Rathayibacter TaxID=2609250 RepID=UPI001FB3A776|nr:MULTISPECIES: MarR family transcriptional regulator [unclassified Rathayibacter]MCJ1674660.1 MarR family transcriptional regulator [Rathayibacter sp. VKM Ac-2929]MCJ1682789.1 MarR family transcriptional regulator [Rathayibacter sp. VKM Ac-2928]
MDPRARALSDIERLSIAITIRSIPRVLAPLLTTDLTIQQLKALSVIVTTEEGATGAGLAQSFGVSMPSMSKLIDRLVASGLVVRETDRADQRVRRIHATDLGRAVVRELMAARPELGEDVLSRLSLEELEALETGLRAISRELRVSRDAAG